MRRGLLLLLAFASIPRLAAAQWPADGLRVCGAQGDQAHATLVPDGLGGAILAWPDPRTEFNIDVYAQRVDSTGDDWNTFGVPLTGAPCTRSHPAAVADAQGGALIAWADDRCTGFTQIYVNHASAEGDVAWGWPTSGVAVCPTTTAQSSPAVVADGQGGAIVVWDDARAGGADVFASHVDSAGAVTWLAPGVPLATQTGDTLGPQAVSDGAGGAFVVVQEHVGASWPLHALRVSSGGALMWDVVVSSAPGARADVRAVPDGEGGVLLAWAEAGGGDWDVYAERLTSYGVPAAGWPFGGRLVAGGAGDQVAPAIATAGDGAAIVAWTSGAGAAADVYAQHLAPDGSETWGADVPLCAAAGEQRGVTLADDGAGGAYAAWTDSRAGTGPDIFATHIDGSGQLWPGWPAGGMSLCSAVGAQDEVRLAADGAGGAYAVWSDARVGGISGVDLYSQRLTPGGLTPNQVTALQAVNRHGQTFLTWRCPPGQGWIYRVYRSTQPIRGVADLAYATVIASLGDSSWYDRRLSQVMNTTYAYAVDSAAGPLQPDQGVWVVTPATNDEVYYAVTAQAQSYGENVAFAPGVNALAYPIDEFVDTPEPIYERTIQKGGATADVYTLWTASEDAPGLPAMANRDGMAFDCAVVRGQPNGALFVRPHARGSNLTEVLGGSTVPGEWVLALDDPLPNGENTFWYGYHQNYVVTAAKNSAPAFGTVVNYTERRVLHTLAWMRRHFPVDTMRVYAMGYSMGGIGSVMLALERPQWIAAVMSVSGKFDFSFVGDPDSSNAFDPGGSLRQVVDDMWGHVATDLPTSEGVPVYQRLNFDTLAAGQEATGLPPIVAFNGRYDTTVGWAEKIGFYAAMEDHRQGGQLFWDTSTHTGGTAGWPTLSSNLGALYAYRCDRSFPALSHCSVDQDPGDGHASSGDSLGSLNGFVTWDTTLTDVPDRWGTVLRLRDLPCVYGTWPAPDSARVDVTPRRTQHFTVVPGEACNWQVRRLADDAITQSGMVAVDTLGLVTVPGVVVDKNGSLLTIDAAGTAVPPLHAPAHVALAPSRNPASGAMVVRATWPRAGAGEVRVLDVSGRIVRTLWNGAVTPGVTALPLDAATLPSGIYFLRARLGGDTAARRLAVVH